MTVSATPIDERRAATLGLVWVAGMAVVLVVAPNGRAFAIASAVALGVWLWLLRQVYRPLLEDDSITDARRTRRSRLADEPVGRFMLWAPVMAPLIIVVLVGRPATAVLLATLTLAGAACWLEYLRRTRARADGDDFVWFDERLEAYRANLAAAAFAASVCVSVIVALAVSSDGLSTDSLGWFVGVSAGLVVGAGYAVSFLTWLDDAAASIALRVVGSASWLALTAPLLASNAGASGAVIAVVGVLAAAVGCVVLEGCRRYAVKTRTRELERQGLGRELAVRYASTAKR